MRVCRSVTSQLHGSPLAWPLVGCIAVTASCGGKMAEEPDELERISGAGTAAAVTLDGSALGGGSGAARLGPPQYQAGGTVASTLPCPGRFEVRQGERCVSQMQSVASSPEVFWIDITEVTRSQYESWLSLGPPVSGQDQAQCGWNDTYEPFPSCMDKPTVCHGEGCGNHPQVCVDWCDAVAYCRDAGKRLCGRIGGGSNAYAADADAALSQWYAACSAGGVNAFPYAGPYRPKSCNGYDFWGSGATYTTVEVGSLSDCRVDGAVDIFDLSGNVYEWEDSCMGSESQSVCRLRGGAYHKGSDCMACADHGGDSPHNAYVVVGFRCCLR